MDRQIISLGGGGFSMEPENTLLDDYILSQSQKNKPKVCFIGTASGDSENYINRFYDSFKTKNCIPNHLSLFKGIPPNIENLILSQNVIYVGGGNTRNLLVLWKEWELDKILLKAYKNGVILSGLSAGSICWFEEGLTDSIPQQLNKLKCLGLLKGSNCPHFDGEKERQEIYRAKIFNKEMKSGFACDDGVALHFVNEKLFKTVSSRKNSSAYKISLKKDMLLEEKIIPTYLG